MCVHEYLHFGLLGPRHGEWECFSGAVRLGKKVRVEIVLVLVFEDLEKTKQVNESQIFNLPFIWVSYRGLVQKLRQKFQKLNLLLTI